MTECICLQCKSTFKAYPSDIKLGRGKFCSRKCLYNNKWSKTDWPDRQLQVINFIKSNNRRPSQHIKEEYNLNRWMVALLQKGVRSHSSEFEAWMEVNSPTRPWDKQNAQEQVIEFIKQNGIRPSSSSADPKERYLAQASYNYAHPCRQTVDYNFKAVVDSLAPSRNETKKSWLFQKIVDLGRYPNWGIERNLAGQLNHHLNTDVRFQVFLPMILGGKND